MMLSVLVDNYKIVSFIKVKGLFKIREDEDDKACNF